MGIWALSTPWLFPKNAFSQKSTVEDSPGAQHYYCKDNCSHFLSRFLNDILKEVSHVNAGKAIGEYVLSSESLGLSLMHTNVAKARFPATLLLEYENATMPSEEAKRDMNGKSSAPATNMTETPSAEKKEREDGRVYLKHREKTKEPP